MIKEVILISIQVNLGQTAAMTVWQPIEQIIDPRCQIDLNCLRFGNHREFTRQAKLQYVDVNRKTLNVHL